MTKLNESIGRFSVRKVLRFSMKQNHSATVSLGALIAQDEQRAAYLNTAKAAIEAEHLTMVRRVFNSLPDPLPDYRTIRAAFEADPEYRTLSGRNADKVMKLIVNRCVYNGWKIPEPIRELEHWATLYVKWHWHCSERLVLSGENAIPRQWAGRSKADVSATCTLLRTPPKRKVSRNYWYDHSPFRMLFGNRTCGMSWLKDDFAAARTFLLLDGERILVGIVPRSSRFCPYTIPDPETDEATYLLYEETQDKLPVLRPIARERIDIPARRGFTMLFELDGKALRGKSNLNAIYLRALFSQENLRNPVLRLDRAAEFHVRKGVDLPRTDKPGHFRQRFTEDKLFVTLRLIVNPQMVSVGKRPEPFGNLAKFIDENPTVKFIKAAAPEADVGKFVGALARRVIAEDACVIFDPRTPKRVRNAVVDKFEHIVLKDRDPLADGGALRGYQLSDRLFIGDYEQAKAAANAARKGHEAAEAVHLAAEEARRLKAERKAANRAKAEAEQRLAAQRRSAVPPDFSVPLFQTGALRFKVDFKTSDNACHSVECRADTRDEMFAKARTVGVRPSRVTCLDPEPHLSSPIPPPSFEARLKRLDALRSQGLITDAEFATQRARIIGEL